MVIRWLGMVRATSVGKGFAKCARLTQVYWEGTPPPRNVSLSVQQAEFFGHFGGCLYPPISDPALTGYHVVITSGF